MGYVNRQANGVLLVVGPEDIDSLAINIRRVVIQMLLNVKDLLTKGGQINRCKNMLNTLMAKRLVDFLLCLKVDLLLVVIDTRKPLHHGAKIFIQDGRVICTDTRHDKNQ